MKKVLIMLLFVLLLCGCENGTFNSNDIDKTIDKLLEKETNLVNQSSNGYKYYLPSGVKLIKSNNYNEELSYKDSNYYLYVDVVSYYYKESSNHDINTNAYYKKILNYDNKNGYIEVLKNKDECNINYEYNYSKIESRILCNDLKQNLINMSYILNSVKFNDSITNLLVSDDRKLSKETFDFFTPKEDSKFIDYINKYGEYEEKDYDNNIGKEENE